MKSTHRLFSGIIFVSILAVVTADIVQDIEKNIAKSMEKKFLGCVPSKVLNFVAPPSLWPLAPLQVVPELDLKAYQGRWYQYSISITGKVKQLFAKCVTVEHTMISTDERYPLFDIVTRSNMFRLPMVQKTSEMAFGTDVVGKFETTYSCQFASRHYWVVDLGPKVRGKYQYSIVGSSNSAQVRVLVRDIKNYTVLYKREVDAKLKQLQLSGFLVKQRKTNHKSCKYEWSSAEEIAPQPVRAPAPTNAPQPTNASQPIDAPQPTNASQPIDAPQPTNASQPIDASQPTNASQPMNASQPIDAPQPTNASLPTIDPEPSRAS